VGAETIRETPKRPPTYRIETIPRLHSVVIYDDSHPLNYIASCQIFCNGDVGIMFTINGQRFYDALTKPGVLSSLFTSLGIVSLEGYVVPSHARLMKFAARKVADVEEMHMGKMLGHDMIWVKVTNKDINDGNSET